MDEAHRAESDPRLRRVLERLSPEKRAARLAEAERRAKVVKEIAARPPEESERAATARTLTSAHRSSYRRWKKKHAEGGTEALIDRRIAPESPMPQEVRVAICTLRRADPNCDVEVIIAHVAEHHGFKASATVIKRVLREAGLARRRGPPPDTAGVGERRVELGGMKLVEAACEETGYVKALALGIVEHVRDLPRPQPPPPLDTSGRDIYGRFRPEYNERSRKGSDDVIGPGFASVEEKRGGKDPERLQLSAAKPETIERKLYALLTSPLIGSGRWDGMRVPRGKLLEELCGTEYMPATLDLFTRELKYAGVSSTLWEVHGRLWVRVTAPWEGRRRVAVFFVDATTKAIWTRLFSQSTNVKEVGRVMPGLEVVSFHKGYGVPVLMVTFSGRAPLVKVVPGLLGKVEGLWGAGAVQRVMVIDAESNSVPFFKGLDLEEPPVGWVTRLREDWVAGKELINLNNYRPYREGDRVRSGMADFTDPEGGTYRMRVVEVERKATGDVVYLGASMKLREQHWKPQELADLYFERWPAQEANFRAVNQAAGLKEVHGYGKRLVANVSVVTELDELVQKTIRAKERHGRQQAAVERRERAIDAVEKELRRRRRRQETVERQLGERLKSSRVLSAAAKELIAEQGVLAKSVVLRMEKVAKERQRLEKARQSAERTEKQLQGYAARQEELESRRHIFAHDVELDSLFSLLKVGLVLLVTYVLREYLSQARMDAVTFLERVATLPARVRQMPELEIVTFEYNRRDPEVMGLLAGCCAALNARALRARCGRTLRFQVDPAPTAARPPPPGSRAGSGDRFKR